MLSQCLLFCHPSSSLPVIQVADTGIQENLLVHKQTDSVIMESSQSYAENVLGEVA
ncbi:MAG: hypothetical protein KTV72_04175 [Wolbachia endosymbiont of Melophagus ovinus]|nr:hypothetical protein [Wolbachia endosymbiont of Melophagus ovinus]